MDAATMRAWVVAAARALHAARAPIDSLNVFPVPDGDTGTNLALTVAEAAEHVDGPGPDATAAEVAAAFARGALLGARGNSGVIVSQYLHGFARGLAVDDVPDPVLVARALHEAQLAARAAVARPVEGTILSAGEAAALAAAAAVRGGADTRATASAAVAGARDALARSPQALDVLRAAGVVDAGATGLVVLLGALAEVLGEPVTTATSTLRTVAPAGSGPGPARMAVRTADQAVDPSVAGAADPWVGDAWPAGTPHPRDDGEFEVMYVVEPSAADPGTGGDGGDDLAPALSRRLQVLGTSVAVVGGADGWHVHVHTDDPAAAVAAGDLGERSQVVVRRLAAPALDDGLGVVAGTSAPGLVADLARAGALVLVHAGRPVTAREVRRAVVDTGKTHVAVLPGSVTAAAAAREAAGTPGGSYDTDAAGDGSATGSKGGSAGVPDGDGAPGDPARVPGAAGAPGGSIRGAAPHAPVTRIDVLDATDDVRVVVALAADPGVGATDRVAAMRAALATARTAAVTEPDVAAVLACARRLLDDGGDLVTVLCGASLDAVAPGDGLVDALTAGLAATHPEAEVVVLDGGQAAPAAALAVE